MLTKFTKPIIYEGKLRKAPHFPREIRKSKMYKYLKKSGYKNAVYKEVGEELKTFPSNKPEKCIDFVMIKGDIKVKNASVFGSINASDHKGIKVTLDI